MAAILKISSVHFGIVKSIITFVFLNDSILLYSSLRSDSIVYVNAEDSNSVVPHRRFYVAKKTNDSTWVMQNEYAEGWFNLEDTENGNGCFNEDSSRFYFSRGIRNIKGKLVFHLYYADREEGGKAWMEPVKMNEEINVKGFHSTQPTLGWNFQKDVPVLYFLSGITCTEQNFIQKSGFQQFASKHQVAVVVPDTSPRGEGVPDNEDYKLGCGAGFYLNATREPWSKNYKMYDYITKELPELISNKFEFSKSKIGIFGHSMGGGGAIQCALKNDLYKSVSAFSPICSLHNSTFSKDLFSNYLDNNEDQLNLYDPITLIKNSDFELLNKKFSEWAPIFIAPEYLSWAIDSLSDRASGQLGTDPLKFEVELLRKNGSRYMVEINSGPILSDSGKIIGIQGITRVKD